MAAAGVAARLARREVRRRPGRTLLVALLVALPVAALTAAIVLMRTTPLPEPRSYSAHWGQADAHFDYTTAPVEPGYTEADYPRLSLVDALPKGSRYVPVREIQYARVRTVGSVETRRRVDLVVNDMPLDDPITRGTSVVVAGRHPKAAGEVAVSKAAASHLGVSLGQTIRLDRPSPITWRVVGILYRDTCLSCDFAVVPATAPWPFATAMSSFVLIDLPDPVTVEQLRALGDIIPNLEARALTLLFADTNSQDEGIAWSFLLAGIVLTVVGIVIAAAFAVGARRQLVTIGQLQAAGADAATVRSSLVLQGTFTGIIGTVAGFAIGWTGLVASRSTIERLADHTFLRWVASPTEMLGVLVVGVGCATFAAVLPARTATRISTLDALAGRRPLHKVPRHLTGRGLAAIAVGLGMLGVAIVGSRNVGSASYLNMWTLIGLAGGVMEVLGACAVAPAIVERLEPFARRTRGSVRLAARGLARQRTRSGAVLSAVTAAVALAICASALILGGNDRVDPYRSLELPNNVVLATNSSTSGLPPAQMRTAIEEVLPAASTKTVIRSLRDTAHVHGLATDPNIANDQYTMSGASSSLWPTIADEAVLDAFGATDDVRNALGRDGAVVVSRGASNEKVSIVFERGPTLHATAVDSTYGVGFDHVLVTPERAVSLALPFADAGLVYTLPHAVTRDQVDQLSDIQQDFWDNNSLASPNAAAIAFPDPRKQVTPLTIELILTSLAFLFAMFVIGTGLMLAAAEAKDERDVLTVAGAPPRTLARASGARAWLLATLGGLLAIPVGFLPVWVFTSTYQGPFPLVFPIRTVLLLVVAAPLVAAGVSWIASATAQRVRPVRVSTAAFE